MSSTSRPTLPRRAHVRRRLLAAVTASALAAGAGLLVLTAPAAQAAPQAIQTSSLKWGVKASFRNYVVNISGGSIAVSDGATRDTAAATSSYTWAGAGGTYDPVTKSGTLDYAGKVVFSAPDHTIWHITIANPTVILDGDATGTLVADVSYATGGTQAQPENVASQSDVVFGDVAVTAPSVAGATSTYTNQAVTLTAAGSAGFNGFYGAGTEMDPLTASAAVQVVTITSGAQPNGLIGKSYSSTLAAAGGKKSYVFTIVGGALPGGLALSTSGKISGTPKAAGTSTFTVQVADASVPKNYATKQISITVDPMTVNPVTLPAGLVGKAMTTTTFKATGGKTTLVWSVSSGNLPPGLKLSSGGALSGTPVTAGTYTFTVQVADANTPKNYATRQVSVTVAPMTINPVTVPSGLVGKAFTSTTFKATGGKSTLVWTVTSGPLPPGLKLSTGGVLSGTPAGPGTFPVTVQVADASVPKNYASKQVTLVIAPMTVATASVPNGRVGATYTTTALKANGGKATLVWSIVGGALPPGLKLSTGGSLSGKPTAAGTYQFTAQVADASTPKNYATKVFTIVVS